MSGQVLKFFSTISAVFLLIVGAALLIGGPLWLLWNWLMPTIFGLPLITFWEAVGLNLMATILFKKISWEKTKKD